MSSKNATSRPKYTINEDGLIVHNHFFVRCGDNYKMYILPESGKRGVSYLAVQQIGRYWYVTELLMNDNNQVYHGVYSFSVDKTKFGSLSQAVKELLSIFQKEEKWYAEIFGN